MERFIEMTGRIIIGFGLMASALGGLNVGFFLFPEIIRSTDIALKTYAGQPVYYFFGMVPLFSLLFFISLAVMLGFRGINMLRFGFKDDK